MCLGALVGAGWDRAELESLPRRLGLDGVSVAVSGARRGPFAATRVEVAIPVQQPHRHLHHIVDLIAKADVAAPVKDTATRVFRRLAEAEAEVHGSTVEKVHFHEVGAADALVDIVGACEGLHRLGVTHVRATTLRLGRGRVQSEHGLIPVPAPATALLLRGIPVEIPAIDFELVTPTGAALMATLVDDWGAPPPFTIRAIGTGAGGRDLEQQPNVLRVIIGDALPVAGAATGRVAVLETAIDDDSPQHVAALLPRLLDEGALDVMLAPVQMKKGRPGLWLVVVAPPERADALARTVLAGTTTLGVRVREERRYELPRRAATVDTAYGAIALKVATLPDGGERAHPEFESVRAAAERSGRGLREVADAAIAAWHERTPAGTG